MIQKIASEGKFLFDNNINKMYTNFAEFKQAVLEAEAYIQVLQAFVSCCPQKT